VLARLIAAKLGAYLPGNPTVIVKNITAVVYLFVACREKLRVIVPVVAVVAVLYYVVFVDVLKVVLPLPYFTFS
jgi:hypothetical protein